MDTVWKIFCEELYVTHILHELRIHMFVLMNNHFHMVVSTPNDNISQCMHRLMGNVSKRLNELGNRINGNFAGRHFKTILDHPNYFLNAYKYNYRNPVTAGICKKVEDYPYSTLYGLLGRSRIAIPLVEDITLFSNVVESLRWLNERPDPEKLEAVRYALKRPYFRSKKNKSDGKLIIGENDIL